MTKTKTNEIKRIEVQTASRPASLGFGQIIGFQKCIVTNKGASLIGQSHICREYLASSIKAEGKKKTNSIAKVFKSFSDATKTLGLLHRLDKKLKLQETKMFETSQNGLYIFKFDPKVFQYTPMISLYAGVLRSRAIPRSKSGAKLIKLMQKLGVETVLKPLRPNRYGSFGFTRASSMTAPYSWDGNSIKKFYKHKKELYKKVGIND